MLGELIIKILALVLGYLYPAFECFRTMEHGRVNMDHLLFWCQYWVIIALLTAIEKFGDIFVSWLPLYGESKLAFIVYLWHPKTKGTRYVYDTFLRPFMADHEMDIERRMKQIMAKTGDLLIFYFKNFVDKGQSLAFEVLDYVLSRSRRPSLFSNQDARRPSVPPPSSDQGNRRRPSPPPPPSSLHPSAPPLEQQLPPQGPPATYPGPTAAYPGPPATYTGPTAAYPGPPATYPGHSAAYPGPPVTYPGPTAAHPVPTSMYPSVDYHNDLQPDVNRVEEALRSAGVNLPGLRRRN